MKYLTIITVILLSVIYSGSICIASPPKKGPGQIVPKKEDKEKIIPGSKRGGKGKNPRNQQTGRENEGRTREDTNSSNSRDTLDSFKEGNGKSNNKTRNTEEIPYQPVIPLTSSLEGTIAGHDYVDLGLPSGLKWATCNIGASAPGDYGQYFAWGELHSKADFTDANSVTFRKTINDISGINTYDPARSIWGGTWRLPTKAELKELKEQCSWVETSIGSSKGYKVIGPNGKFIFLPEAGYRAGTIGGETNVIGFYWSSTPDVNIDTSYLLYFNSSMQNIGTSIRSFGNSVRPVSW